MWVAIATISSHPLAGFSICLHFCFRERRTSVGHFSGNMVFALDEFEIDAVAETSHKKLAAVDPQNVNGAFL